MRRTFPLFWVASNVLLAVYVVTETLSISVPLTEMTLAGIAIAMGYPLTRGRTKVDILEPIYLFMVIYVLYFFIKPALLANGQVTLYGTPYSGVVDYALLAHSVFVAVVFLACFCIGYSSKGLSGAFAKGVPAFREFKDKKRALYFLGMAFLLGTVGWIAYFNVRIGGIGNAVFGILVDANAELRWRLSSDVAGKSGVLLETIGQLKNLLVPACYVGYIFVLAKDSRITRSGILRALVVAFLVLALAFNMLTGFRSSVVLVLLGIFVMHYYFAPRSNIRWGRVALLVVVVIVVTSAMTRLRYADNTNASKNIMSALVERHIFESLWAIDSQVPNHIPYYLGQTYVEMFVYRFIPRSIWAGKPKIYGSDRITEDVLHSVSLFHSHNGVSIQGELYANFGLFGVIVGGGLWGLLMRSIYRFLTNRRTSLSIAMYAFFWVSIPVFIEFGTTRLVNWMIPVFFLFLVTRPFSSRVSKVSLSRQPLIYTRPQKRRDHVLAR